MPPTMKTSDGRITNAVYGFASFLIKAIRDLKPEYVVLTLDMKGPTFRHEKYTEYKATRVKAPDELYEQIPLVRQLAVDFNIPVFEKSGFEADDLIGTITKIVPDKVEKIIVTGDKDTLQLVDENTKVYSMSRGLMDSILYTPELVVEKMGVTPEQVIDYKALRGDPSDNIPGVPGIGEKTAVEIITAFDSLDKLYAKLDKDDPLLAEKLKPRIIELLKDNKDKAYLSQDLATIKCDVPIDFVLEDTRFRTLDKERVFKAFRDLEFNSLLPRLQALFSESSVVTKEEKKEISTNKFQRNREEFDYKLVTTDKEFQSFLNKLKKQTAFSFDTETSGFDSLTCDLLGISFSWAEGEAYFLDLRLQSDAPKKPVMATLFNFDKPDETKETQDGKRAWLKELEPIFLNPETKKVAHNGKFDIRMLKHFGIEVANFTFDTMIAAYLLNPGSRGLSLDAVTMSELGFEKISKDNLLGSGKEKQTFSEVETERLSLYSCEDADYTFRLAEVLAPKLKDAKQEKLFNEIEIPLIPVLVQMEENGVKLDKAFLADMGKVVDKRLRGLEEKIHELAGMNFNIKSTQQLKEVLFEKLQISDDKIRKTKTGISTAADELEKLKDLHPIIGLIQEYRELIKLSGTYIEALPKLINPKSGRVHTHYNQTIAATGRLSSTDPNLQNIPIRTELGKEIRKAFVAEAGYKLLALDYSQIELRLAAHLSDDPKMIAAFQSGADIHTATAAEINGVELKDVTPEMRREAKATNFGILYGQGAHGLAQTAGIDYGRAREFIDNYFKVFAGIKVMMEAHIEFARQNGYVETLLGRRRYLPDIGSTVGMVQKAAERMAVNTPVQGTAADMLKMAMIKVHKEICSADIRMILTVHDELIFEVKEGLVDEVAPRIKGVMENVMELKVPVVVDVKVGDCWGKLEKLEIA